MEHSTWHRLLKEALPDHYFSKINQFMDQVYSQGIVYPPRDKVFNALLETPFEEVRVVILGQDPYHGPNQAHGLSFSVLPGVAIPPSLRNIYKELYSDLGIKPVNHGYLEKWAKQGVLMLNSVLTVRNGQAFSHQGKGWEKLTDEAIKKLSERPMPVVFILWGAAARKKAALIDRKKNIIIESPHPSPLSANRGFFGSRPFSKTNAALEALGETPIDWQLPEKVELTEK